MCGRYPEVAKGQLTERASLSSADSFALWPEADDHTLPYPTLAPEAWALLVGYVCVYGVVITCKFRRTTSSAGSERVLSRAGSTSSMKADISLGDFSRSMAIQRREARRVGTCGIIGIEG